jgi:hypothetical protein
MVAKTAELCVSLAMISGLLGCSDCLDPKYVEVKSILEKNLKIGDSRDKVSEALSRAGIGYSYDQFQRRYQSTVYAAGCNKFQAVSVYVYFNATGNMTKFEALKTYTAP